MLRVLVLLSVLAWPVVAASQPLTSSSVIAPEAMLVADDAASGDQFGIAVAVDADLAVVGSYARSRAYVYRHDAPGVWTQIAVLTPPDGSFGDQFGRSVAISGRRVLVGAPQHSFNGAVYVFAYTFESWSFEAKLAPSQDAGAQNGFSVAFDGMTAIVHSLGTQGAHIYSHNGAGTWHLDASFGLHGGGGGYGNSVDVDGERAVFGLPNDIQDGARSGSVVTFIQGFGGTWSIDERLYSPEAAAGRLFGYSVALDGDRLLIGAAEADDNGNESGAASIWDRSDSGWTRTAVLPPGPAGGRFGFTVALDSERAVVGSVTNQGFSGGARVFVPSGETWVEGASLEPTGIANDDQYGISVALSGASALVGSVLDDTGGGNAGAAYAFDLTSVVSTVDGPSAGLSVSVAPNPASGVAAITVEAPLAPEARVDIVDMAGRTVATVPLPAGVSRETVGIEGLAPGVYVACLIAGESVTSTRFVIAR